MKQIVTKGIVLARTNFGEADRIITILTPDHGKLRLMAKGVRRPKSRVAGGVELFSTSDITYIRGRSEIGTLVSARLDAHYRHIVESIDRTMLAYELIKQINKATEDETEEVYFTLLSQCLKNLDDTSIPVQLIRVWFGARLLALGGFTPELYRDSTGTKLLADERYEFDYDTTTFLQREGGRFNASKIKLLRLLVSGTQPQVLQKIDGVEVLVSDCMQLVQTLLHQHIRQ